MTEQKSISLGGWALMLLLGLIWGASFLANRVALAEVGVFTTVAFRVGGAALVLWAFVVARGLPLPRDPRLWAVFAVAGFLNNALPFSLIVWGQRHIDSGLTAILNASTAIFSVLLAAMLLRDERLTPTKAVGVSLGFVGVATVIGIDALSQFDITSLGQLAVICASVSYGFAVVWARVKLRGITPAVSAAGMLTSATVMIVPMALWFEGMPRLTYAPATWAALGYLSVIATAVAFLLYYITMPRVGAGNFSLVTLLVAPVAIALGAVFLNETLLPQAYVGFALLALGLVVIDGRLPGLVWRRLRPQRDG